jgi:hypothetical protein
MSEALTEDCAVYKHSGNKYFAVFGRGGDWFWVWLIPNEKINGPWISSDDAYVNAMRSY